MANPNIVSVSTINGNTGVLVIPYTATGVAGSNVVGNPAASGMVYKINTLMVTNNTASLASVSLELNRGGTNTAIAYKISVPTNSTLVLLGKDTGLYLLENDALTLASSATNALTAVCSWEQIS